MKRDKQSNPTSLSQESDVVLKDNTTVGDISGGKGFAIGTGARAIVVEIGSLFNLGVIFTFIKKHWLFIFINVLLQAIAIILWLKYANRFLIPFWVFLVGIFLLELSLLAGYGLKTQVKYRLRFSLLLLGIFIIPMASLITMQYERAVHPPKFQKETFGVAIAQFGEGPEFRNTRQAREISELVYQQLLKQVQENPDMQFIQFRPIGLVSSQKEASIDGSRIGADLVIWGQLQVSENQTVLNFSILETPEKISDPEFPRVLPIYDTVASSFILIEGQGSKDIAKETTRISALTFGLAHFFNWDFGAAARAFENALSVTPFDKDDNYHYFTYLYYGLSLQGLGHLEAANEKFQQAIDIHPEDPAPWLGRAFGNRSLTRMEEAQRDAWVAVDLCSKRIQLEPDDYIAYYDRALANEILINLDASLNDHEQAREKAPDLFIADVSVIRILILQNRFSEAIQTSLDAINKAEKDGGNPAWAYLYLAYSHQQSGDFDDAKTAYEEATDLAPQIPYMHKKAGEFFEEIGDFQSAEEEFVTLTKVSSNKPWAYSNLAKFYFRQGELEKAVREFRLSLQYDPEAAIVWTGLANVYAEQNRYDDARQAFNQAIKLEPEYFYHHYAYGNFLFTQGELESAIVEWEATRQSGYFDCGLYLNIGNAYELLGDLKQAEVYYREASSISTDENSDCQVEAAKLLENSLP